MNIFHSGGYGIYQKFMKRSRLDWSGERLQILVIPNSCQRHQRPGLWRCNRNIKKEMDMRNTLEIKCSGFYEELAVKVLVGMGSEMRRKAGWS